MDWGLLLLAGFFEIAFTTCMKLSDGFRKPLWSVLFVISALLSFAFLAGSLRTIPVGTAYAVWTGIGAAGTATIGIAFFGDPAGRARIMLLALVVIAIAGLRVVS